MEDKIFIERNRNIKAVNKENKVNVNLTQKARLLPYNNISDTLNLNDLFLAERDACNKYRLIFTINPVCSNVLYNMKTEVVYREGGPDCQALVGEDQAGKTSIVRAVLSPAVSNTTEPVTRTQAIRDTEYSHPYVGGVVYHCGADIFNNHMLRSTGFVHVNRMNKTSSGVCGTVFNTIEDYVRDGNGNMVTEVIGETTKLTEGYVHNYHIDNIISMDAAFAKHVKSENGWYGFDNVGFMEIPNGADGTISINKLMNNNKSCEFIDFYPDRSLFSFIPKVNKERHRIEKNWDYCITYPWKSDYDSYSVFSSYYERGDNLELIPHRPPEGVNGIRCKHTKVTVGSGHDYMVFTCQIKHNLTYGDTVRMYDSNKRAKELFVIGLGDSAGNNKEHCFRVYENDFKSDDNFLFDDKFHWFKKLSNQTGCEYYLRVFRKLKDADGNVPDSSINKLAFGENIYGDRTAQIIYTDDIDLTGLKDNRGRPISELYLTIVKTNRGHEKWYKKNIFNDPDIEFSHCFGEVTSGIETDPSEIDFNIRHLNNVDLSPIPESQDIKKNYRWGAVLAFASKYIPNTNDANYNSYLRPRPMETNLTVDGKNSFFGDVVEFDPSTNKETVLDIVQHRFNTAQRETSNPLYYDILEDELMHDDYDEGVLYDGFTGQLYPGDDNYIFNQTAVTVTGFTVNRDVKRNVIDGVWFPGNICPEGYYYQAHYKIPIREISSSAQTEIGAVIDYDLADINAYTLTLSDGGKQNFVDVTVHRDYQFIVGDLFGIYNESENRLIWGVLDSYTYLEEDAGIRLKIEVSEEVEYSEFSTGAWQLVLTDGNVPSYASYVKKEQKFVWRDVLKPSEATSASGLNDVMFSNGAIYLHNNINFFLKRQDATGEFGLLAPRKGPDGQDVNPLRKFKKHGTLADFSQLMYLAIEAQNACM